MDNASFHPKAKLDKLAIGKGHYFLPLPPYSPELNPIEQYWATLKNKVRNLLRAGKSVYESLEYCL
ncbi:transposase [Streptococcus sp. B01]